MIEIPSNHSLVNQLKISFIDLARLIRLPLSIAAGVATVSSMVITAKFQDPTTSLLMILTTYTVLIISGFCVSFLLVSASQAINDYIDFDIDCINKRKDRPLTLGRMSRDQAKRLALFMAIVALIWTFIVFDLVVSFLTTGFILISFLYSLKLKRIILFGNFVVAFCSSAPYLLGALAIGLTNISSILVISAFISITLTGSLSREIIKDAWDIKGDLDQGFKTLPSVIGIRRSAIVSFFILLVTLIVSLGMSLIYFSDNWLFLVIIFLTNSLFLIASIRLIQKPEIRIAKQGRYITRVALLMGALAFLVAALSGLPLI